MGYRQLESFTEGKVVNPYAHDSGDVDEELVFTLVDEEGNNVGAGSRGLLLYKGGTVCDDGFDRNAAEAICTAMGHAGATSWDSGFEFNIQEDYTIKMDEVQCRNDSWVSCEFQSSNDCSHSEDIFLVCQDQGKYISVVQTSIIEPN